ncbi:MAG TPA: Dam family site-specific DNA-(adenine-N6)-methyltransferase [Spirochaetes bacterium]|nr:Dam family site-specific DNA-(adenine-N6)-methyltransferase [Spirochaetota bacterium]
MANKSFLPKMIDKVIVPPIKCQGIKTQLVNFISKSIYWDAGGKWIEPFLGSGVVLFSIQPDKALVSDTNKHIIKLYQAVQSGDVDEYNVRLFLEDYGSKLSQYGKDFYYSVREDFNETGDSLKFLFLNRSCFNGLMRFNSKARYNVPFGHKPNRFSKSYITRIVNQIARVGEIIQDRDWVFQAAKWQDVLKEAKSEDFVYLDPPYIGRYSDYFSPWSEGEAIDLAKTCRSLPCGFALSMWYENKYRRNDHIHRYWPGLIQRTCSHYYHVGSKESLRNEMLEALLIRPEYAANSPEPPFD